jgi:DNA-cytosine methyltransferase
VDNTEEFTHISLCAGYGGLDIGLKRAIGNVRTIAFSEIEAYATANLVAKMEKGLMDAAPVWSDLKTFPWKEFYAKVDILSGGFPCQPFSGAGRRAGDDDPRHLWPYIVKGIKQLGRPPIIFLENVEGILSSKLKSEGWSDPIGTPVLQHVFRELERLGYKATAGIFSASEVGAPHQRKRVFILAVSNELTESGRSIVTESIERSEVVNSNSDGLIINREERRVPSKESDRCEKGSKSTWYAERSSESNSCRNLSAIQRYYSRDYRTAYPSFRGQKQHGYEAPRTVPKKTELGDSSIKGLERGVSEAQSREKSSKSTARSSPHGNIQRILKSKVGGTTDGFACGLGTSEQFRSYDNRTDELRMLGNGVVPNTASRAFRKLWKSLADPCS